MRNCKRHGIITRLSVALLAIGVLTSAGWAEPTQPADVVGPPVQPIPSQKALDRYNRGVELFQLAQIQLEKGNPKAQERLLKKAIEQFEEAIKQESDLVEAQSNIGFAWLTLEKHGRAIDAFNRALKLNPKHLNTLHGLMTAFAFDKQVDKAIEVADRLTLLDPGEPTYFYSKGSVLQRAGRFKEARAAYEEALRLDPNHQRSLFNLATLLENQGKLEEAKPFYERAKGIEVGNIVGLEAIHRLEAIEIVLKQKAEKQEQATPEPRTSDMPEDAPEPLEDSL